MYRITMSAIAIQIQTELDGFCAIRILCDRIEFQVATAKQVSCTAVAGSRKSCGACQQVVEVEHIHVAACTYCTCI